ncbi:MAG: hypothetical protein A2516_07420 [Alphaproteobacteria bacterium RIFOXYD12_FULL_60_8]|nr:MAG: hypothetical protein A2516_07420 [Alphaproteobacteria bacterium RIFOXYD12_FULL_60_8]
MAGRQPGKENSIATASKRRRKATSSLSEKIAREIAAHKRRQLGQLGWPYLNNFHCRLPGGLYRSIHEREEVDWPYTQGSRKLRGMTHSQFFGLIDALIKEMGLDAEKIKGLQNVADREILDYCFPLYVRLREEGFQHYPDLTS